ncbi:hypothetical protein NUW58_g6554 [Xylaria curta]|uniref:Uncharacterized protein n=1 Tax=Xylaria curta TaxID=42375 RepID=A0ACC1NUF2_9PEZI|nr:hypothetical protein NUW58_g6554 [Xylaria curta]
MTERKPCHNCRKRRLRCDRSVPACFKCSKTGQKCLGYGKLYRWIDPEAPVGQSAASTPSAESDSWVQSRARGGKSYSFNALGKVGDVPQQELDVFFANPPLTILLADPLLQDLGGPSRHYLSYFASRFCQDLVVHDSAERGTNPFRELIPMSQTYSYLQHIIIAASAVHYYHAISNSSTEEAGRSLVAQNALVDALQARQVAIKELIAIIQERRSGDPRTESQADQDALLATVLFFVNFTLIESGKDGWKDHLAAAGRLLSLHAPTSVPLLFCAGDDDQLLLDYSSPTSLDLVSLSAPSSFEELPEAPLKPLSACDYVTSDTVAYFIWNCALESLPKSCE